MKYYNICSLKEYEEHGEKKRKFYPVGYIKETENGGKYMTLYDRPNTTYCIFDSTEGEIEI